jgi:hypothetical protein
MMQGGSFMAAPQNFRSAFNGFNREDVVHYLEYINAKHMQLVNQLTSENQQLRAAADKASVDDQGELVAFLQAQVAELIAQLEEEKNRCAELTGKLEALEAQSEIVTPAETISSLATEELEAYRRAERIEREARERSELVYFQANSVLTEAFAKVDTIANDITDMADQVMRQLTQLQISVSSSKQALQDAASIMGTIRPNK